MDKQNMIRIFEYAMNQEETGKSFFETSVQRMGVGAAAAAFKRLIEEESRHIRFINAILGDLKNEKEVRVAELKSIALEPTNYFDARSRSEFLEQCINESMVPDVTVFNTAWLIEKDLSEFYENMAKKASGEPAEALNMLARWEKAHERFFRQFRDQLTETYAKMPWGG